MGAGHYQQLLHDTSIGMRLGGTTGTRQAQHITIVTSDFLNNKKVVSLGFWLWKSGVPTGNANLRIRDSAGTTVLWTSPNIDVSLLPTTQGGAAFTSFPVSPGMVITTEVYFSVEFSGGDPSDLLEAWMQSSDVVSNEQQATWTSNWIGYNRDMTYDIGYVVVPAVTSNAATGIQQFKATLNGLLNDDGGEACTCGFDWGLTPAYGNTTATSSQTIGQTFAQTITGLAPNTTYHFRAKATNFAGTTLAGDQQFTTLRIPVGSGHKTNGLVAVRLL